jgi:glycosyltransferase involved in cell wall biosynthesis
MRILHADTDDIDNPLRGGQPVRTFETNSRLSGKHEITILTATYPGSKRRVRRGRLNYSRLGITLPGLGLSPHMSFLAMLGPTVLSTPHDLVIEEFTPPVGFCMLPWWTNRPVISVVQWFFFKDWERRYKLPFERIMRIMAKRANYGNFIVQTELMGDYFRDILPAAKVWRVPCGLSENSFQIHESDGRYALFLGRLDISHKGLDMLLDVWQRIVASGETIPLCLAGAGAGSTREYLENEVRRLGLSDSVRFLGRVEGDAKAELLKNCRFMVMPSRQETFGLSGLEAMASSKPVICFDIDHLNEVLRPRWAILAKPWDVDAFAAAVVELWRDPERCRVMGAFAFDAAQGSRWSQIAERQDGIYAEVATQAGMRK